MHPGIGVNDDLQSEGDKKDYTHLIPVIEEHLVIEKKIIETGRLQIIKTVKTEETEIDLPTSREEFEMERVSINEYVENLPVTREEGDVTIIPVVHEVVVMVKKLLLVEEIRVTKRLIQTTEHKTITLRKDEIKIVDILNESHNNNK